MASEWDGEAASPLGLDGNSMLRDLEYKASDHVEVVVSRDRNPRFSCNE